MNETAYREMVKLATDAALEAYDRVVSQKPSAHRASAVRALRSARAAAARRSQCARTISRRAEQLEAWGLHRRLHAAGLSISPAILIAAAALMPEMTLTYSKPEPRVS